LRDLADLIKEEYVFLIYNLFAFSIVAIYLTLGTNGMQTLSLVHTTDSILFISE